MKAWLLAALVVASATVVAGCVSGPTGGPAASTSRPKASVTLETGGVEGLVVNDEFLPIPGANVSVAGSNLTAVSDAGGRFAISDMAPADYVLVVRATGFKDRKPAVTIAPGEVAQLRVIMEAIPGPVPYIDSAHSLAGYFNVAAAYQVNGQTSTQTGSSGTAVPENVRSKYNSNFRVYTGWNATLFELQWTPGQSMAEQMRLRVDLPDQTPGGYSYSHFTYPVAGRSPLKYLVDEAVYEQLRADRPTLMPMAKKNGAFYYVVQPYVTSSLPVGVFIDQRFSFYATVSYWEPLPPDFARTK